MFRRADPPPPPPPAAPAPAPRAWTFIGRALRLRCPECGISRLFVPFEKVRSLDDWFRPLDGCPRCGYAYEREQGYWLIAIWGINYGIVGVLGVTVALLALEFWQFPIWKAISSSPFQCPCSASSSLAMPKRSISQWIITSTRI